MTINELMVLNRGIDNKKIVGVPEGIPIDITSDSKKIIETKSQLIQNGILENYDTFTIKGALIFSRLIDYKKAKKYVCIQGMWIGILDKNKSVVIQKKETDSYHFESIETDSIEKYLFQKYQFLQNAHETLEQLEKYISEREFYQMYFLESKEGFLFDCIENSGKKEIGSLDRLKNRKGILYFQHENQSYRYDIHEGALQQVTGEMIKKEIHNRMRVEN